VTEAEIQDFLAAVNKGYAAAKIKREEVTFFYSGFLPMEKQNPKTGDVGLLKHYAIHDHAQEDKVDNLISVIGVKYTTAWDVGMKTVNLVFDKLNKKAPDSKTEKTPIYGGQIDMFEDFVRNAIQLKNGKLGEPTMRHLSYNYGSSYNEILEYGKQDEKWREKMPNSKEVIKAEVLHGVREEMAMKLQDVILRRTDLGSGENPGQECLKEAAQIMANELSWHKDRIEQEIKETNNIYVPV
jgi:glycerol-3-phosphate dehydrogenase